MDEKKEEKSQVVVNSQENGGTVRKRAYAKRGRSKSEVKLTAKRLRRDVMAAALIEGNSPLQAAKIAGYSESSAQSFTYKITSSSDFQQTVRDMLDRSGSLERIKHNWLTMLSREFPDNPKDYPAHAKTMLDVHAQVLKYAGLEPSAQSKSLLLHANLADILPKGDSTEPSAAQSAARQAQNDEQVKK